jgi:hypothetical protein
VQLAEQFVLPMLFVLPFERALLTQSNYLDRLRPNRIA